VVVNQAAGTDGRTALYQIDFPAQTTADIVVTFSGATTRCAIATWAVYGAKSAAHDTAVSTADPLTDTINVPAGGVAIGIMRADAGVSLTWSGLTEKFDALTGEGGSLYSGASDAFATLQTGLTVTADGSTATTQGSLAAASWGPA
jgi:hypothetical protein